MISSLLKGIIGGTQAPISRATLRALFFLNLRAPWSCRSSSATSLKARAVRLDAPSWVRSSQVAWPTMPLSQKSPARCCVKLAKDVPTADDGTSLPYDSSGIPS